MSFVLSSLIKQLDIVALSFIDQDEFALLSSFNDWFSDIWPVAISAQRLNITGASPFLDNFLLDAISHWKSGSTEMIKSGPFIENLEATSKSFALEASALSIDGQSVLLLTNLGESYNQSVALLQAARENLLTQEALEAEVSKRTIEIRERESEVAGRLIYAAGFRDEETGAHIKRIGLYAAEIATSLGWSPTQIDDIKTAAPMHDIGKIGIPDSILKKPGKLTKEEFTIMRRHPEIGAEILANSQVPMIRLAAEIAGCHHEHWDGNGYPDGLAGEDIPIGARIVAIVDVYDALVHERVYKNAYPEEEAISMMSDIVATQFDPTIFQVFTNNLDVMRAIRHEFKD